jgi:putative FmdB family regulatory protein
MPIYVYKCATCEKTVEELQRHNDPPPQCCTKGMDKQLTVASFRFRAGQVEGGGWERQGELMIRRTRGNNSTKYGEGSV